MNYRRGMVLLVPIIFTDGEGEKVRPCVVVSSDIYNRAGGDLIVLTISSVECESEFGCVPIVYWNRCGLNCESYVHGTLVSIDKALVKKLIGIFQPADMESTDRMLTEILSLNS